MINTHAIAISLDMINRHYSEPNRNRYESKYYWEELYTLISAAGFKNIEIPYEPFWMFGGRSGVPMTQYSIETKYGDPQGYLALLSDAGIKSVSAISFDSNLFMRNNQLGFYHGATGHFAGEAVQHAANLSAQYFIYSPTPYRGRTRYQQPSIDQQLDDFKANCRQGIKTLAEKAQNLGIRFCLKPEFWSDFSFTECLELAQQSEGKILLAINTAHLHLIGLDPAAILTQHPSLIGYIQLSDTCLAASDINPDEPNPTHPSGRASQVFADVGKGNLALRELIAAIPEHCGISMCNHQTRDPMRALLRNRLFINQLEA